MDEFNLSFASGTAPHLELVCPFYHLSNTHPRFLCHYSRRLSLSFSILPTYFSHLLFTHPYHISSTLGQLLQRNLAHLLLVLHSLTSLTTALDSFFTRTFSLVTKTLLFSLCRPTHILTNLPRLQPIDRNDYRVQSLVLESAHPIVVYFAKQQGLSA